MDLHASEAGVQPAFSFWRLLFPCPTLPAKAENRSCPRSLGSVAFCRP
jgi:hypothetical protein